MTVLRQSAVPLPPPGPAASAAGGSFVPRFVRHRAVEVLRLDYAELGPAELPEALDRAGQLIRSRPPASLRILTLLGSGFDAACADALKRYAVANAPHVLASAAVAPGFWNAVVMSIKLHARRDLMLFRDEASALDWLAGR